MTTRTRTRATTGLFFLACLGGFLALGAGTGVAEEAPKAQRQTPQQLAKTLDAVIDAKLESRDVRAAPRSDDAEFLRRLYLDLIGTVPTVEEVEAFLGDRSPTKRQKKIEELLASDAYADHWSVVWFKASTGLSPAARGVRGGGQGARYISGKAGEMYLGYLSEQMSQNTPYDEWVHDLIVAEGRTDENGATGFIARWSENTNNLASATAKTFLGTRIQCAQCHDHIYEEKWKQKDFRGMAAFFGNLRTERAPEYRQFQQLRRQMEQERQKRREGAKAPDAMDGDSEMGMDGEMDASGSSDKAKKDKRRGRDAYPGMENMSPAEQREMLQKLRGTANVLVVSDQATNPRAVEFARRRLEQRLKRGQGGQGAERLKERMELAATTPKFWMASEAADIPGIPRRLLLARWITSNDNPMFARTVVNRYWGHFMGAGIVDPVDDFSSFNEPSHPEILDALAADFVANGYDLKRLIRTIVSTETYQRTSRWTDEDEPEVQHFAKAPVRQLTTEQLYHALVRATGMERRLDRTSRRNSQRIQQAIFAAFSFVFDDDEGVEAQDFEGSIPQGLFLMNGRLMQNAVSAGRGSMLSTLMRAERKPGDRVEYLYLALYGRKPTANEKSAAVRFVSAQGGDHQAYEDILWAMLNSAEFMTNH
ncbi:MAG: DUF1549 and DUF1553 domain-containing protein [Planctomycetota bacterium]|nr:DUF1549 and DUF1553 domain-containing protein [Planctomycetota bacterium]